MKYYFILLVLLLPSTQQLRSQSTLAPIDDWSYHWLDRLDILYGNPTRLHYSLKATSRRDIANLVHVMDSSNLDIKASDLADMQWLADDNNEWQIAASRSVSQKKFIDSTDTFYTFVDDAESEKRINYSKSKRPFLKHFYKSPAHFFEVNNVDFKLRINPLLNFRLGKSKNDSHLIFENQRGISIRGVIDKKVYFHTQILESQARYPDYVTGFRNKFKAIPGAGFVKTYNSSIFDVDNGVDFLLASGYVGTSISKHVQIELGHNRHFIGNGIRSLFLSDFSTDYFYLKLNTRVWKFHYQNIFGELIEQRRFGGADNLLPKRYFAAHYLSLNIARNLYVGLFETVVFARENQFELQYLNPVILYRTVEGSIGSPDNVLLGIDLKYNLWRKMAFYSQFILDEFKVGEIRKKTGWWANKFAFQAGLKLIDIFSIDHLDAQLEYNMVRPYTYSHRTGIAYYGHYNQALSHPLGANLREGIFRLTYQPARNLIITGRGLAINTGEDRDTLNWGANFLLPNDGRVMDFGNEVGQGVSTKIKIVGLDLSYQLRHGLFVDLFYQTRKKTSAISDLNQKTTYIGSGIRWNLRRKWHEF